MRRLSDYTPNGQERIRSWFALLPVTVDRETRWLERVTVLQRYVVTACYDCGQYHGTWKNVSFCNV